MKKRGEMTTEEAIKLFFAILAILALLYLGVSITNILLQKYEIEQAKSSIQEIQNKIDVVKSGTTSAEFVIVNPKKGLFFYFPNYLSFCFCKDGNLKDLSTEKEVYSYCNSNGYCQIFDKDIIFKQAVKGSIFYEPYSLISVEGVIPFSGSVVSVQDKYEVRFNVPFDKKWAELTSWFGRTWKKIVG